MKESGAHAIRAFQPGDEVALADIYNWYIANTVITFEEEAVSAENMAERTRSEEAGIPHTPWFVVEEDNEVLGYAYAAQWKARTAYRSSRETSVYLRHDVAGRGLGSMLYSHLINEMRKTPIHLLIAGIALPNAVSIALHESMGFTAAGKFTEVGRKFDRWVDVGYWQLAL